MNIEKQNVQHVYDIIADHFSITRNYIWNDVKQFIDNLPKNSYIFDSGCGNGKNMYRNDCVFIGGDLCEQFLKITKEKNHQLF